MTLTRFMAARPATRVEVPPAALERVDELVERGDFGSRDEAVAAALEAYLRDRFPSLEPQVGGC